MHTLFQPQGWLSALRSGNYTRSFCQTYGNKKPNTFDLDFFSQTDLESKSAELEALKQQHELLSKMLQQQEQVKPIIEQPTITMGEKYNK